MVTDPHDVLDTLYEAAVIPERWPNAIEGLSALVGCPGGALLTVGGGALHYVASKRYDLNFRRYMSDGAFELNVRPKRALARRHHGFLRDIDLCSLEELAVDPIYEEYLRPIGIGWTAGTMIPVPGGDMVAFEVGRGSELGPFEPDLVATLDELRPHLARSAHLAARLGLAQANSMAEALGAIGLPAAVLRADKRVVAVNALFERLAPQIDTTARDRLIVRDTKANRLVQAELEKSNLPDSLTVRSIPVPGTEDAPPLILHLTPIRRSAQDIFGQADWIAVITPIESRQAVPDSDILQGLFDLTAAEARVTRMLLAGSAANNIAKENDVSINTVRSQIRAVLMKTGVSRQIDLIHLLSGSLTRN